MDIEELPQPHRSYVQAAIDRLTIMWACVGLRAGREDEEAVILDCYAESLPEDGEPGEPSESWRVHRNGTIVRLGWVPWEDPA